MPISSRGFAAILALAIAPFAACAQPTEADALAGPKVTVPITPTVKTLVVKDSSGKVERLDTRPEAAAVELLGLDVEQRKAADAVLSQHSGEVAKLLRENQTLFLKIQTARQGNASPAELRPLMQEFRPIAAALIETPLRDRVSAALPDVKRAEFARLVREYLEATNQEDVSRRPGYSSTETPDSGQKEPAKGDPAMRDMTPAPSEKEAESTRPAPRASRRAVEREEMVLLLREMARTLGAVVSERQEQMAELYKAVDATPEQQAKIEKIIKNPEFGEPGNRTQPQRTAMRRAMISVFTPEQQQMAREFLSRN